MQPLFSFRKLQNRLFLYFLLLVLIPLITLGCFSYLMATRFLEEDTVHSQEQTMTLIAGNIGMLLNDAADITSYIANNESLRLLLDPASEPAPSNGTNAAAAYLDNINKAKSYITFLVIYGENGFVYRDFSQFFREIVPYSDLLESPVYIATASKDGDAHWTFSSAPIFSFGHSYNEIMIGRRLVDIYDRDQKLGMLFMGVDRDAIAHIIEPIQIAGSTNIFVFDGNYNIVAGKHEDEDLNTALEDDLKLKEELFQAAKPIELQIGGKSYLASSARIDPYEWHAVSLTPISVIKQQHGIMLKVTLALAIVLLITVGLISAWLSKSITSPIKKLLKSMSNFKRGDFNQNVEVASRDEIGLLSQKYNEMVSETNDLIQKVYVSQTHQKMIELKTLQTQIQPHFLYNTLDFIFLNSKMNGDEETAKVVQSLSELFRLSLNRGKDYYTVNQEMNQIKAYIHIQHARFPNRFRPEYDVDTGIGGYYTMKLLLQPIVENAILHAFHLPSNRNGILRISARREGDGLVFEVRDNGCGMGSEQAKQLLEAPASAGGGYGIRNVNERLTMMFGKPFGLQIDSELGQGTRVILKIPLIESEQDWRLLYENHGH